MRSLKLILYNGTVTTHLSTAPSHDRSICQDGGKSSLMDDLNVLHILKLCLNRTAVTAPSSFTPGHDRSIGEDSCKSCLTCLDVLHVLLALDPAAVATIPVVTPNNNRSIGKKFRQKPVKLLGFLARCLGDLDTNCCPLQSVKRAAKASAEAWICFTFFNCLWTALLLPPASTSPRDTTDPSARMAAKAPRSVDWMCITFSVLAHLCCHHRICRRPKLQQIHPQERQQKHCRFCSRG